MHRFYNISEYNYSVNGLDSGSYELWPEMLAMSFRHPNVEIVFKKGHEHCRHFDKMKSFGS
jgi:hypothetical protein